MRPHLWLSLALGLATQLAGAVEYDCYRLPSEPTIDGTDGDAAWRSVPECYGFHVLGEGVLAADRQTSFRAGHTSDALFLFVRCEETATDHLTGGQQDGRSMWSDDSLELFFIPASSSDLYNFVANWTGARWNGMGQGEARPLWSWVAKTRVTKTAWTLEAKIPFSLFSRTPADGERWQANLGRNTLTGGDRYTCWPPLKVGFRDLAEYGVFIFRDSLLAPADCARLESESASRLFAFLRERRRQTLTSEVIPPLEQLAAESRSALAGDRHPAFARLRQRLADLRAQAQSTATKLDQAQSLPPDQWRPLFDEVASLQAEVPRLRSDLALLRLYPARAGEAEVPFVLGTAGRRPWMDESGLAQCDTTDPVRLSLVSGESASFRAWIIPFWRELKGVTATVSRFRSESDRSLPPTSVTADPLPAPPATPRMLSVTVRLPEKTPTGAYLGRVTVTSEGRSVDRAVEVRVLPGRRLNNFAIELADFRRFPGKAKQRFTFENPRDGWIYVRLEADAPQGDDRLWLTLDSEDESQAVIVAPATETTRRLPAGPHFLVLGRRGKPRVTRLTVRAVPEIIYASYRYDPRIGREFGVFDWDFLNRYVLPHVNTINGPIGLSAELAARHAAEWRRRGGRCVRDTGLPHLDTSGPMPTVDGTCQALTEALSPPHLDAILADECILAPVYHERNLVYAEAFARLAADPGLKGKQIYPYIAGQWLGGRGFLRRIAELPWPMVVEYYCIERKTEAEAATHVADHAETYLRMLREIMDEPQRRALFALFYETLSPCSADIYPQADFKVFLDMQLHHLATAPGLCGIYGVESYTSGYTDEETLRWTSRLFRHYCFEGRTDRLTTDPYLLPHLKNPDFANGLQDWETAPAEEGSIKAFRAVGLGKLMGFWPGTPPGGDDCLLMKRSAKGSNRFSQTIRGLTPGRLYSLKLFTYDVASPSVKQRHAVSLRLDNVEVLGDRSFQAVFPGDLSWSARKPEEQHWLNCHHRIFRAQTAQAKLTVSDWPSDTDPGGPVGQELVYDFVELQPYFEAP